MPLLSRVTTMETQDPVVQSYGVMFTVLKMQRLCLNVIIQPLYIMSYVTTLEMLEYVVKVAISYICTL